MTIEVAVRAYLAGLSAVVARASTRVYLDKIAQSTPYPCVRVQLISDPSEYHLRGVVGMSRARVQVDAYDQESSGHDPYSGAMALADAIHGDSAGGSATGLSGYVGTMGGSPAIRVMGCFRIDRRRGYDPEELRVVYLSQDYMVIYRLN